MVRCEPPACLASSVSLFPQTCIQKGPASNAWEALGS